MAKKNNGIRYIIYLIIFGVFCYYEYELYKKYAQEKIVRDRIKEEKTQEIEKAFLLREENFYLDKKYEKNLKELKKKESIEKTSLLKGDEAIEQRGSN